VSSSARASRAPAASPAVSIRDVHKSYAATRAVDGISLEVSAGGVFGLLGPNGAGKTTLIETVVGLRAPTSGQVRVLGLDPRADRRQLVARVGVSPQEASLFPNLTVRETLALWRALHDKGPSAEALVVQAGLEESAAVRVRRLSGGQRQRLLLACASAGAPELLLLDEPSAGLDPHARQHMWEAIRARRDEGQTVVLTTHAMDEAEALCDRVAIMDRGRLVALDAPDRLVAAHGGGQAVSFELARRPDLDAVRDLEGVDGVEVHERAGRVRVRVATRRPEAVLQALLGRPDVARLEDLRIERASLEQVFLALTGQAIADDGTAEEARS